jgi:transcriptional regulator GlxA family with amidase domain
MLGAFLRLVEMLDRPERIPALAPSVIREIHYYALTGPLGGSLRLFTQNNRIAQAISWLRENYREPLRIAALAARVSMAESTFNRHFRTVTGLSPLQFQKRLRLYEAQRLMLTEDKSAETAAYEVGYDSPTQFNREYKRQFGEPPRRDIQKMLATKAAVAL